MSGGQAINAKRGGKTTFQIDPLDPRVYIVGVDDGRIDNVLYDPDETRRFIDEGWVEDIVSGKETVEGIKLRIINKDWWDVAEGRRRLTNAREAARRRLARGMKPLMVTVFAESMSDDEALRCMISGNQRRDWHIVAKAELASRLHSRGMSPAEIGAQFRVNGKSLTEPTVMSWLRLNGVSDAIKAAVIDGRLRGIAAALALSEKTPSEQVAILEMLQVIDESDDDSLPNPNAKSRGASAATISGTRGKRFFAKFEQKHAEKLREVSPDFLAGMQFVRGTIRDDQLPFSVQTLMAAGDEEVQALVLEHGLTNMATPPERIAMRVKTKSGRDLSEVQVLAACRALLTKGKAKHSGLGYSQAVR